MDTDATQDKLGKPFSVVLTDAEQALVDEVWPHVKCSSRNEFVRACILDKLNALLVCCLSPVNLQRILRLAPGQFLTPVKIGGLLTGPHVAP